MKMIDAFWGQIDRTVYDFSVDNLDGEQDKLSKYKGHVVERYEPTTDMDIICRDIEKLLEDRHD